MVRRSGSGGLNREESSVAVSENESINRKIADFNRYNYDHSSMSEVETTALETGKKGVLKTVRAFDHNGWMTEETEYFDGNFGVVNRYRYEVDEHGNWVKRYSTTYNSNSSELGFTPSDVVYREIRYYDGR